MKVAANSIPKPAPQVTIEMVEGECLAYDPQKARVFYLNASAVVIWGLCNGVRSTEEICRMIGQGYPGDSPNLLDDVMSTIAQLEEGGLLVLV